MNKVNSRTGYASSTLSRQSLMTSMITQLVAFNGVNTGSKMTGIQVAFLNRPTFSHRRNPEFDLCYDE